MLVTGQVVYRVGRVNTGRSLSLAAECPNPVLLVELELLGTAGLYAQLDPSVRV